MQTKGNKMKTLDEAIEFLLLQLEQEQTRVGRLIAWMKENREAIEHIGITPSPYGNTFDFDNPDREQVLKIIKAFPGKWDKQPATETGKINYTTVHNGQRLRIWCGAPPDTCRIVEEKVFVPEHYEVRKRMVCKEDEAPAEQTTEEQTPVVMES